VKPSSAGNAGLVIATHNKGKLKEFAGLLAPYFDNIVSASDLSLPEPEETGATFTENALLKARAAAKASLRTALADDSGICIAALGGAPGIYSGRYAETPTGRDFKYAMRRIETDIGPNPDRSAAFVCVLALSDASGNAETFEGRLEGTIAWPPRGDNGHGYDPIFVPAGETRTFAEMNDAEKNAISHRGRAVQKLIERLGKRQP